MYESEKGFWYGEEEEDDEDIYEYIEQHRKELNSYLFPDTEKIGCVHIHYNRKLNASFVKYFKEESAIFFENYKYYKRTIASNTAQDSDVTNVYIYPDLKSFNSALGNATVKVESAMALGLKAYSVLNAYIIRDDLGDIHVVLPSNRSRNMYEAFYVEIMALVLCNYDEKFKTPEGAKVLVKDALKIHAKQVEDEEEEAERKRQEEEEEKERLAAEEKEREEEERLAEEERQRELEEAEEEEERLAMLEPEESEAEREIAENTEKFMQELSAKAKVDAKLDKEQAEKFLQFFLLYRAAKFHRKEYLEAYAEYIKKHKLLTLGKIKKADITHWADQCTLALQIEYIINRYGYKTFAEYSWKFCDKSYSSNDLYMEVFGVPKFRFENELKAYCNLIVKKELPKPEKDEKETKTGEEQEYKDTNAKEVENKKDDTKLQTEYPNLVWFVIFDEKMEPQSGEMKPEQIKIR